MARSKKYVYQLVQENDAWAVEIIRRVTSKKTVLTKRQDGFVTEDEAEAWGKNEVKMLIKTHNLNERNKRRAKEESKG
ncbi:MAG: DUF3622 domain-containing protein [Gammaproteobacteria bacterium]|nr:DUF3622 domain-containing protein [Gammaproteobacteria bacterium]MDH5734915.1 DUF3622 domain-containing protein [Gammaproteobacteria bacterium]